MEFIEYILSGIELSDLNAKKSIRFYYIFSKLQ